MEKVAVADVLPEAVTGSAEASVVVAPLKVSEILTVPERVPLPVVTVTVKLTLCPNAEGLGVEVTTVLVAYNGSAVPTSSIWRGEVESGVPDMDASTTSIIGVSWVLTASMGEAGGAKIAPTAQSAFSVRVWPLEQELVTVVSSSASGGFGGVSTTIDERSSEALPSF